ncbi:hypothetical protein [Streptomyces sp. NPDC088752]|uniref:hypothetical protein n=1 Tax=Streptomyces sp. NPDC088752 TaxID=3154963 RepID=UPI00341DCF4E
MGVRAQYVVIENGTWHLYYSHGGGSSIVHDLLPGPVAATRRFRENREIDRWINDVWCEGAALVDHDRRILLWFAFADSWTDHLAARIALTRTWPGWEVCFAHDGVGDLTHHLGLGRDLTRPPGWFETFEPSWTVDAEAWSVVSLRLPAGKVLAWGSGWEPVEHLARGPGLIDLLSVSPTTPPPTHMPYGGVHFDPQARTVSLWAVQTVAGVHDWPLPGWEGWTMDFQGDDHTRQAALLPMDFPLPRPSLTSALWWLDKHFAALQANPAGESPYGPLEPTQAELAEVRTALNALITQAESV